MTAPMTAPAACTLPSRIFSSTSGCAASASSIAAMSAPSSETTARPRASTTSCGVPSPSDDALEHLAGELVGEGARVDQPLQRGDVCRRDEIGRLAALRVRDAGDLARPPLARRGGRRPGLDRRGDLGEQAAVGDVLELEVAEAPLGLQTPATFCGRLGERRAQLLRSAPRTAPPAAGRAPGSSGSRPRPTSDDPATSCRCPRASDASPA